jgi:uncharacterized protein YhfF
MINPEEAVAHLAALGITLPPGPVRVDGYGDSEALSNELLDLIRSGRKRAGTGLLWASEAEGESIGQAGDIEIVVDHHNRPCIVTRLLDVYVVPFRDVSADYAAIEGEGDGSLDFWRRAHWAYFSRECARIGRIPGDDMPVVCSTFEVLHVLPLPS